MSAYPSRRPRLRVSVFNAEEIRAAIEGGANDIDCEDPRTDVGMFEPRVITDISYALRQVEAPWATTSANIGFDLQAFERATVSRTTARSVMETRNKAAQEALGLAAAMDVGDGRSAVIKFGVDGTKQEEIVNLVAAVKKAVRNSRVYQHYRVVGSFLVTDLKVWNERKVDRNVVQQMLELGQFYHDPNGTIDLHDYKESGRVNTYLEASLGQHLVGLIEPYDPAELDMPRPLEKRIQVYTDLIADAGADGVLIDTPIQAKLARICLVNVPENRQDDGDGERPPRHGVCSISELEKFSALCRYRGVECWVAGSVQPYHARRLGQIPGLDVVMCRGSASAPVENPYGVDGSDDRAARRISPERVRAMTESLQGPQKD
jgi:uncharacterized protein (UPF0264 family)